MRYSVLWLLAIISSFPASAQSLEETALTLQFGGRTAAIRQEGAGVIVVEASNMEIRVIDAEKCVVRLTDRNRPAFTDMHMDWSGPPIRMENTNALYEESYFGRVVPQDVKKAPDIRGTRNGVVVEQIVDGKWRLPGSPGDEVRCYFWPNKTKSCQDHIDIERISPAENSLSKADDTARVDRALVHLYADLCKGAQKRVPF